MMWGSLTLIKPISSGEFNQVRSGVSARGIIKLCKLIKSPVLSYCFAVTKQR